MNILDTPIEVLLDSSYGKPKLIEVYGQALLGLADAQLYCAKKSGRGRACGAPLRIASTV